MTVEQVEKELHASSSSAVQVADNARTIEELEKVLLQRVEHVVNKMESKRSGKVKKNGNKMPAQPIKASTIEQNGRTPSKMVAEESFGIESKVSAGGRPGAVIWDGRPEHKFVKLRWDDDGTESDILPLSEIKLVVKASNTSSPIGSAPHRKPPDPGSWFVKASNTSSPIGSAPHRKPPDPGSWFVKASNASSPIGSAPHRKPPDPGSTLPDVNAEKEQQGWQIARAGRQRKEVNNVVDDIEENGKQDLDGFWVTPASVCQIEGDTIVWSDGTKSMLKPHPSSRTTVMREIGCLVLEGCHDEPDVLMWNDGDVWNRLVDVR